MGWFWSDSTTAPSANVAAAGRAPTPSTPSPASTITTPKSDTNSGDQEMQKFWEMIQADAKPTTKPSPRQTSPPPPSTEPPASSSSSWFSFAKAPAPPAKETQPSTRSAASLALSEYNLPTTMSCRDAFDYAWHCQSPGGQWVGVFRDGTMRSCSELWEDFWFCMRVKSYGPELKAEAIREYYREKERVKYDGPGKRSSEDVWESRDRRVEGDVFGGFRKERKE